MHRIDVLNHVAESLENSRPTLFEVDGCLKALLGKDPWELKVKSSHGTYRIEVISGCMHLACESRSIETGTMSIIKRIAEIKRHQLLKKGKN